MRSSRSKRRPAYTLLEIIIVMVIIVIIAAISVPLIQSTLAQSRIDASGDLVRGKMAEARARAMQDGRPWRFSVLPGSGSYQLAPDDSSEWDQAVTEPDDRPDLFRDSLPQDIIFALTREDIFNSDSASPPSGGWQTVAVFTADGAALDDATIYFGKPGISPLRATVRGLTGTVSIESYKVLQPGQ
jgi:prepilin-type N-terminal cleavage/methylation domain-containing protein